MIVGDLERHLLDIGYRVERLIGPDQQAYLVIIGVCVAGGSLAGKMCDVAILRSNENPWVPQAALQVRPVLLPMGEKNTQASPLGSEWQYWSRRFDRIPTPRDFLMHILTVLSEV
jgi:hypothetical protein